MAANDSIRLPIPSHDHATCAWCDARFATIVELLDHVDGRHLPIDERAA